jgi:hypothetical protein
VPLVVAAAGREAPPLPVDADVDRAERLRGRRRPARPGDVPDEQVAVEQPAVRVEHDDLEGRLAGDVRREVPSTIESAMFADSAARFAATSLKTSSRAT